MKGTRGAVEGPVYQLKVTLKGSKPPIWRRLQVPGNITLHRLHIMLQAAMGWSNYHLYRFQIAGKEYGEPDPDNELYELDFKNSRRTKLWKVVPAVKSSFTYEYDFGDGWKHQVVVEKIMAAEPGAQYPVCLAGKRACPPEDCGGIWGYERLLQVIGNPSHEEYEEMMEWLGGRFDPDEFDLDKVNRALRGETPSMTEEARAKTGRNEPCPCGSGKKYKKCCGKPVEAPPPLPDRRLMERNLRSLQKLVEGHKFKDASEANAFFARFNAQGKLPEWTPETPLEKAQELVYQALEADSKKERIRLATQALQVSQDCADAYVLLAEEEAEIPEQARDWYQSGMEAGERALGAELFKKDAGHFWGIVETRPYMRARAGLADCLWVLGQQDAAIAHYRELLRLNPNDNQGIRYRLLSCLIERRDLGAAEELIGRYPNEITADWYFSRTLVAFMGHGDCDEARRRLREATKRNPHVLPYLLGRRRLPGVLPERVGLGDESEAIAYVAEFGDHWRNTPGALDWLNVA